MKCEKPITDNMKEKVNALWAEMRDGRTLNLEEVC